MSYQYDLIVFIGRLQPFHIGHEEVIRTALTKAKEVLVLVGSSNSPRTSRNPWTFEERAWMIRQTMPDVSSRIRVRALYDQTYNDQKWVASVQEHIRDYEENYSVGNPDTPPISKIALIGHTKDETSYYLKMFPQWASIEYEIKTNINATDVRNLMFEDRPIQFLSGLVSPCVLQEIIAFKTTDQYAVLHREYEMVKKYKRAWQAAPYAPTFVTTDAIVIQSGHILVIERDAAPGEGLMALPGGFLEQHEWIEEGMLRELREETRLKVPAPVLKGSIKATHVFDAPNRSQRGRTITHAFLIELPPGPLPQVKGGDDARKAFWKPIGELKCEEFFDDHYHMIQYMLGKM